MNLCKYLLVLVVTLSLTLVTKAQSCPPASEKKIELAKADTSFITVIIKIKDSNTKQLIQNDFKVSFSLKNYSTTLNKVSDGIVKMQIPKEFLNTSCRVKIEGEGIETYQGSITITHFTSDIFLNFSDAAKRKEVRAKRKKERKIKRYLKKRRKHIRGRFIGTPDF